MSTKEEETDVETLVSITQLLSRAITTRSIQKRLDLLANIPTQVATPTLEQESSEILEYLFTVCGTFEVNTPWFETKLVKDQ